MSERSCVAQNSTKLSIKTVVHPTDCSEFSTNASAHALRIAVAARADFYPLHVTVASDAEVKSTFPQWQRLLTQWGLIEESDKPEAIDGKLGTRINNIKLDAHTPNEGILRFLGQTPGDLIVLATHGRDGLEHWLKGSIAETALRQSAVPTLLIAAGARGFVRQVSGDVTLRRVLIPIDHRPAPARTIDSVQRFCRILTGHDVAINLLHVGNSAPVVHQAGPHARPLEVMIRYGNVVKCILDAAFEYDVDLIAMPTAGRHGVLDALRGSTTDRVVRHAPCPVYAVPAG